jgi:hypothetical protein
MRHCFLKDFALCFNDSGRPLLGSRAFIHPASAEMYNDSLVGGDSSFDWASRSEAEALLAKWASN